MKVRKQLLSGPVLICIAAMLWATDGLFRANLSGTYTPLFIVFLTHLICLLVAIPMLWKNRFSLKQIKKTEWGAIFFLALACSVLAMIFFTSAFSHASNYSVPILLQKIQPIIALSLARVFLAEKLNKTFYIYAMAALIGAYLISFSDFITFSEVPKERMITIVYSLLAASFWGAGTVAGKYFLRRHDPFLITSIRYVMAFLILLIFILFEDLNIKTITVSARDSIDFLIMALVPGLFALTLYYVGLKKTNASTSTICELCFPFGAVILNWIFLGSKLQMPQLIGSVILLSSITAINIQGLRLRNS